MIRKLYNKLHDKLVDGFIAILKRESEGCKTFLDVGCGHNSPIQKIKNKKYSVGVDLFGKSLKNSKTNKLHDKYYNYDIRKIDKIFKPNQFDCVLCLGVIEHLEKKEGEKLIRDAERIARKKVIFWMPNGFVPQGDVGGNIYQIHKSGWKAKEMQKKGYRVKGVGGHKYLGGQYPILPIFPKRLRYLVNSIIEIILQGSLKNSFEIICIKTQKKKR